MHPPSSTLTVAALRSVLLWLLGLSFAAAPAQAQAQAGTTGPSFSTQGDLVTRFSHISLDQGLSQSEIRSIAQDSHGFLWFGTSRNGLNRFDGHEVRVYANRPGDNASLGHNFIRSSFVDRDGQLWIGTAGGGLYRYRQDSDDFESFRHEPDRPTSLPHNSVMGIAQDRQGRLWFATRGGLGLFHPAGNHFEVFVPKARDYSAPNLPTLRTVLVDRRSQLVWFGSSDGLVAYDPGTKACQVFVIPESVARGAARNAITSLQQEKDGRLWVGSEDGLYTLETPPLTIEPGLHPVNSQGFRRRDQPGAVGLSLSDPSVNSLLLTDERHLWVGTNHGLNRLDITTGALAQLLHEPGDPQSLSDDIILSLFLDAQKTLWVGTQYGGINRLMSADKPFKKFIHKPGDANSLTHDFVTSIVRDHDDRLWVGTTGGLNCIEGERVTRYLHRPGDPTSLSANLITDLAVGARGSLWISTLAGGLNRWDGKVFHNYLRANSAVMPADGTQSFSGNNIDSLYLDPQGRLWIGARSYGLDMWDGATFHHWGQFKGPGLRRPVDNAMLGYTDEEGCLWFGSAQRGLIRHDPRTQDYESFIYDAQGPHSSQNTQYHDLQADSRGILWIGTVNGLLCFDTKARRFLTRFGVDDGLPSDTVTSIVEDKDGLLWLGTTRGLVHFDPAAGRVLRVYTRSNGLPSNEFSIAASLCDPDGRLWFGTLGGLCSFHPHQLVINETPPPVVLTELELGDSVVHARAPGSPLQGPLHRQRELVLPRSASVFSLKFAALDYTAPEGNTFVYRMEGFDAEWRHTTALRRFATYTNLPPGSYRFVVKAANSDGVWNDAGTTLPIVILPAWHETTLFRLAWIGALVLGAAGAFAWRSRAIRQRNSELQKLVELRTAELRASKDELEDRVRLRTAELAEANSRLLAEINERRRAEANLLQAQKMEAFGQLAGGITHDFNNILTVILGQAQSAGLPGCSARDMEESLSEIGSAALRASNLTRQLLVFSRREAMRCVPADAVQIVQDLAKMLGRVIGEDIRLEIRPLLPSAPLLADPSMLEQVLLNMAVNSRDAMPRGGELVITVDAPSRPTPQAANPEDWVRIRVKDTGSGIPAAVLPHIFEPFYTTKPSNRGTGLGLATSASIVQQHGGHIEVASEPGSGTEFSILLPRRKVADASTSPAGAPARRPNAAPGAGQTILLVEDELNVRASTAKMLRRLGHEVLEAENAAAGLALWRERGRDVDLLISDIVMPGEMNGRDMAMLIRREKPGLPVLLVSGYDPDMLKRKADTSSFPRLDKPFTFQQLAGALESLAPQGPRAATPAP